jgi:hypothetical protein
MEDGGQTKIFQCFVTRRTMILANNNCRVINPDDALPLKCHYQKIFFKEPTGFSA